MKVELTMLPSTAAGIFRKPDDPQQLQELHEIHENEEQDSDSEDSSTDSDDSKDEPPPTTVISILIHNKQTDQDEPSPFY